MSNSADQTNLKEALQYDKTFDCVQCGYCLPSCPTYVTMGKEKYSPRGRINLVKMAAEGKISVADIEESIDLCLGCRACETACPTSVQYGKIYEAAKELITEEKKVSTSTKAIQNFIYDDFFPDSKKLNTIANAIWLYQKSGLKKLVNKTKITHVLPENLWAFEEVLPQVTSPRKRNKRPKYLTPVSQQVRFKVAFFKGCIMDAIFEKINRQSIELLSLAGCEVFIIDEQTCCGALHAHSGKMESARNLAKRNIEAFEQLDVDFIVNNAGGCGAFLHEYDHLFENELEWKQRAQQFVAKNKDISEVLTMGDSLPYKNSINEKVTYQPSCHMTNVQKVIKQPTKLIKQVPGVQYEEMELKDQCCGSAGIYNVVHYTESMEILDHKMSYSKKTQAATIVTTNPGCLLQMKLGIKREGLESHVRAVHLIELLAEAVGLE